MEGTLKRHRIKLVFLMAVLLIANTLTGCGGANEDAYSAEEILANVDQAYAQAQSYRDTGTVEMISNDGGTGTVMPFATVFSRPDLFRFEYTLLRNGVEETSILWRNGDEASVWRYYAPWVEAKDSFSLAVAGMTGVSYGAAHTTSRLLMTDVGAFPITRISEVERLADERIDGSKCFRLRGTSGTSTVTLWIDKKTFMLRRVERDFSSFIALLSFDPVLNGAIDDELLALNPPTEMSISGQVADGYLENARVCLDRNGNRQCDQGEPTGMTDSEGRYLLHGIAPGWLDEAPLIAEIVAGMTIHHEDDSALPVVRDYLLSTPPGAYGLAAAGSRYFLSPLTTMVHEVTVSSPDLTLALAVEEIREQLGTAKDPLANYILSQDDENDGAEYQRLHRVAQAVAIALQQQMEQLSVIADINAIPYTRAILFAAAAHRVRSFLNVFGEAAATDTFDAERVVLNNVTYPQTVDVGELLANALLLQTKQIYASASSYQDTGTAQSSYLLDGTVLDSIEVVFSTAFVRPDRFRFEFAESRSGLEIKNILWRNGAEVLSMDGNDSEVQTQESFAMGIAGMTGMSSGTAQIIPQLLLPDELPLQALTALTEVHHDDAAIDSALFFRVSGIVPNSIFDNTVTFWIDKESYLIHRVEIESQVSPTTINLIINYSPIANGIVDVNLLAFNPAEQ